MTLSVHPKTGKRRQQPCVGPLWLVESLHRDLAATREAFEPAREAAKSSHRIRDHQLAPKVIRGVRFEDELQAPSQPDPRMLS